MRHVSPAFAVMVVLLSSGCMGWNPMHPPVPTVSMPYPNPGMTAPRHPMRLADGDGPSLEEACHLADRYVIRHFSGLQMVAAQSDEVGGNGSIGREGTWHLLYSSVATGSQAATVSLVPAASSSLGASSSLKTQATDVPNRFDSPMVMLTVTGDRRLLAPESSPTTMTFRSFDFIRAIPLRQAIEAYQRLGWQGGSYRLSVMIRATEGNHAVYELRPSPGSPMIDSSDYPPPYQSGLSRSPSPDRLLGGSDPFSDLGARPLGGTFVVDAYAGTVATLGY